jgi:hypothetical protein
MFQVKIRRVVIYLSIRFKTLLYLRIDIFLSDGW